MEEDRSRKKLIYTFLYLLCFYLAITFIPFEDFIKQEIFVFTVRITLFLVLLAFAISEVRKIKAERGFIKWYLYLPLLIACCSNFICALCFKYQTCAIKQPLLLTLDAVSTVIKALLEEIIFRYVLIAFLSSSLKDSKYKSLYLILLSSLCFSLIHLLNLISGDVVMVLLQICYTFILGLVCSSIYLLCDKRYMCVIAHCSFNLINMTLFSNLFSFDIDYRYVLLSIFIALLSIAYLVVIYFLSRRRIRDV